jgi:hypothetical protein
MKTMLLGALIGVAAMGTTVPLCAESPTSPPSATPALEPSVSPAQPCEADTALAPFVDAWMTEC